MKETECLGFRAGAAPCCPEDRRPDGGGAHGDAGSARSRTSKLVTNMLHTTPLPSFCLNCGISNIMFRPAQRKTESR